MKNREMEEIRGLAEKITSERFSIIASDIDQNHTFPWDNVHTIGEAGFNRLMVSEKDGGLGFDRASFVSVVKEIARACAPRKFLEELEGPFGFLQHRCHPPYSACGRYDISVFIIRPHFNPGRLGRNKFIKESSHIGKSPNRLQKEQHPLHLARHQARTSIHLQHRYL